MGPSYQDEVSAATSDAEHQQLEPPEPSRTSTRIKKQLDRFGELIPKNSLKKEGGCEDFRETSRNLEVFLLKFQRTKEELLLLYR